jgi:ADP-ribosylglycohydrolase
MKEISASRNRIRGMLLGTAAGDALGLPMEGLSRRRAARLFPGPLRHRLLPGRGMVSDDTDHAVLVANALIAHPDDPEAYARSLAWGLRGWLLSLPAGVGWATLRAILRLWLGFGPDRSGVASAGNGPAMRSAPVGILFAERPERMGPFLSATVRITHTDPRAETGAAVVARAAAWGFVWGPNRPPDADALRTLFIGPEEPCREWNEAVDALLRALAAGHTVAELAEALGQKEGVSGYVIPSVAVAVYAWVRHYGDYRSTVSAVIDLGGDTDTVAAVAGAMAGATVGESAIPEEWIAGLAEWPRTVAALRQIADRLDQTRQSGRPAAPVRFFGPAALIRNLFFLTVVLAHGLRRLFPPY